MTKRPDNWRTQMFVGAIMTAGIVWAVWALLSPGWAAFAFLCAAWEGWTLINRYKADTISEVIWEFARRPMVPHLFGIAVGLGIASGYFGAAPTDAARIWAIGYLCGHFFFPKHDERGGRMVLHRGEAIIPAALNPFKPWPTQEQRTAAVADAGVSDESLRDQDERPAGIYQLTPAQWVSIYEQMGWAKASVRGNVRSVETAACVQARAEGRGELLKSAIFRAKGLEL